MQAGDAVRREAQRCPDVSATEVDGAAQACRRFDGSEREPDSSPAPIHSSEAEIFE
jgi:hypothetical protein